MSQDPWTRPADPDALDDLDGFGLPPSSREYGTDSPGAHFNPMTELGPPPDDDFGPIESLVAPPPTGNDTEPPHISRWVPPPYTGPSPEILAFLNTHLNPPQVDAVTYGDGPLLILAGAGSGKTRVISYRIAFLLRERQVRPWQILAVTFTNKAAKELAERVIGLAGEADARQVRMGTFHGLCARFLRLPGVRGGAPAIDYLGKPYTRDFTIYDTDDQVRLLKRLYTGAGINLKDPTPQTVVNAISRHKDHLRSPAQAAAEAKLPHEKAIADLYRRYQEAIVAANAVDFGDLVNLMVEVLERHDDVREQFAARYRHVLVDEYQDVNEAQYRLVKAIAGAHRSLTVVGDDSQAIYGWRGADVRYILQYEQDFPECEVVRLEQNYRSTGNILAVAQAIEAGLTNRHQKRLWTANHRGDPVTGVIADTQDDEARFILREIDRLRGTGLRLRDVAILYRTNAQSRAIEETFVRHRLDYQLVGGTRFYERREIKEVLAWLRLLVNPFDLDAFVRAAGTRKGLGDTTIDKVVAWAPTTGRGVVDALVGLLRDEGDEIARRGLAVTATTVPANLPWTRRAHDLLLQMARDLDAMRTALPTVSLPDLFELVLQRTRFRDYLLEAKDDNGEERWENVQELRTVVAEYASGTADAGLRLLLENAALVSDADTIKDTAPVESADGAITLMTLHTAKGLEYPAVFITGMEEGIFPHMRALEEGNLDEERRLCYVGFTRAKQFLYLIGCKSRMFRGFFASNDPSRFLGEIPPDAIRWVDGNGMRLSTDRVASIPLGSWPGGGVGGSWGRVASDDVDAESPVPIRSWSGGGTRLGGPTSAPMRPGMGFTASTGRAPEQNLGTRRSSVAPSATPRPNGFTAGGPRADGSASPPLRPGLEGIPGLRRASDLGSTRPSAAVVPPVPIRPTPQPEAPRPAPPDLSVGDLVAHATFGNGTIIGVDAARAGDTLVQVRFDDPHVGTKKLAASLANLTKR
jgi:DNA helicase-2/ATP-dependent DNA helicase PcrA